MVPPTEQWVALLMLVQEPHLQVLPQARLLGLPRIFRYRLVEPAFLERACSKTPKTCFALGLEFPCNIYLQPFFVFEKGHTHSLFYSFQREVGKKTENQ